MANGVLTIDNESGSLWTCNFNPFNLSDIGYSLGPVYEPLMFVNTLQSAKTTPWLASAYSWSNGNKTLTFTIRNGVKWSDGKPMTRGRRGLHVQPAEEVQGARHQRGLVGAVQRQPEGLRPGGHAVQAARR